MTGALPGRDAGGGFVTRIDDLAGRPMRWSIRAGEGPTIVFANGCGLAADHWEDVIRRLPGLRLVAYDRPGMGGTPWPGTLPTLAEEVASLAALVERAGGPAIVVAHSMASFHAEALARLHLDLVCGLVVVDGSVENLASRPRGALPILGHVVRGLTSVAPMARLGIVAHRVGAAWQSRLNAGHDWDPRFAALYREPDALAMGAAEASAYWGQAWDLLRVRAAHPWPAPPTLVLTAYAAPESRDWLQRQQRYARLLQARQVVIDDSHHLMMIDDPYAVAAAIRAVRAAALSAAGPAADSPRTQTEQPRA